MYKSAICHLHSIFEGNASTMSGFCHEASKFGIDVAWISDHDICFLRDDKYWLDFDHGYSCETIRSPARCKIIKTDSNSLMLETASSGGDWQGGCLKIPLVGLQCPPILARPNLFFKFKSDIGPQEEERRLFFRLQLGQVPPEYYYNHALKRGCSHRHIATTLFTPA